MNNKINEFVDILDECAMLYFEDGADPDIESTTVTNYRVEQPHTNYFECILAIYDYFLSEQKTLKVKNDETLVEINDKLAKLEELVNKEGFTNEDIRKGLLLLDIKAFKNVNFSLDIITPDVIGIIIAKLVNVLAGKKKNITILDPNVGTGNMLFTVANNAHVNSSLVGIDSHELMARIAAAKANMLQTDLNIFLEDALTYVCHEVDIVVSDPASYDYDNANYHSLLYDKGVKYFPYLLVEHLLNMEEGTKYLLVVDADFFKRKEATLLKEIPNFNVQAFIGLPQDMFIDGIVKKGIIVFDNSINKKKVDLFMLPSIKNQKEFLNVFNQIESALAK